MAGLSDEAILMLTKLDQARMDAEEQLSESLGWVDLSSHKKQLRAILIRLELMRKDSQIPNFYHITDKGQAELLRPMSAPVAMPKGNKRGKVSPLYENGNGLKPVVPAAEPAALASGECDGCDGKCVYRQAVEILAARVPGTNELVEALKLLNKAR